MRPRTHQSVQAAETLRCFRSRAHRQPMQPEMREGEATAMPPARRAQPPSPPPWEALPLVAPLLDAASLAAASCVSTSWHAAFAADYLWARLCARHYPSALGLLRHLPDDRRHQCSSSSSSSSPHRRLFALFSSASARRRTLPAPRLALADVAFAVDISAAAGGESILSFAAAAAEVGDARNAAGLFLFGVDVRGRNAAIGPGEWRVRWTAVRTARRGGEAPAAVLMMDATVPALRAPGAVSFGGRGEAGVSANLPAPGCGGAMLEAEVVVELAGEERLVEKVRLGVLCECRYVSADDGLRYLQHFLL